MEALSTDCAEAPAEILNAHRQQTRRSREVNYDLSLTRMPRDISQRLLRDSIEVRGDHFGETGAGNLNPKVDGDPVSSIEVAREGPECRRQSDTVKAR